MNNSVLIKLLHLYFTSLNKTSIGKMEHGLPREWGETPALNSIYICL